MTIEKIMKEIEKNRVCYIEPISSSLCISEIYLALVYCEVVFSCHFKSWIEVCKSCSSKNCFN